MIIDLNKLNRYGKLDIDEDVTVSETLYKESDIRALNNLHATGKIEIDFENNLNINLVLNGKMILPCAVTLNDVSIDFESNIEENLSNFDEIIRNNKNRLDISEILWENIVLEIPIRVVDENIEPSNTTGDGWELIS